ncbi:hypothetical protein [Winogradskyella sp. A3E31]|uniref:hypothetical protein n=1 Tax=Winogradskyella sp. A3E31 TaxID=3349637 RepID=UPI00398AD377
MKLFNLLLLTVFAFATTNINAQGPTSVDVATERLYMSAEASKEKSALGSPYINEKFMPATIKRYKNTMFLARFNAYNGELQVDLGNGKIIALDANKDYELMFKATNKIYKSVSYISEDGVNKRGFLVVLEDQPDFKIYKKEHIEYIDAVPAATSYQRDKPAKFEREDDIYLIDFEGSITYLPTKKKDLIKKFPKQAKKIKSFMKDNDLNPKEEEELIQIVNHITTL